MPSNLFKDDFESGDLSKWDSEFDPGGVLDVHPDGAYAGANGLRVFNDANISAVSKTWAGVDACYLAYRFQFPLLAVVPSGVQLNITSEAVGGATLKTFFRKNVTDPQLLFQCGGGQSNGGAYANAPTYRDDASWQSLEILARNQSGQCWAKLNGTTFATWTAGAGATQFTGFFMGNIGGNNWSEYEYYDNVEAWDGAVSLGTAFATAPKTALDAFAIDKTAMEIFDEAVTAESTPIETAQEVFDTNETASELTS